MPIANRARRALAVVAVLLVGVCSTALGAAALDECAQCAGKGVVECRGCASKPCASERGFLFCSFAADCGDCGGVRAKECDACEAAPDVDPQARRAEIAAWRDARKSVDQAVGRTVGHGESAHFVLASDLKKADGEHAGSPHGALHAYLDRLEQLHAEFVLALGCAESDFSSKTTVMIWSREADQRAASAKYTMQRSDDESKLMGAAPVVSLLYDYGRFKGDRGLHQSVVHQTAHCLLSNVYKPLALGNAKHGWIDEGLAHYFEGKLFGDVRRACYLDPKRMDKLKPQQWRNAIRESVASGEAPSLAQLAGLDVVAMDEAAHRTAWSMCEHLATAHPGTAGVMVKMLKSERTLSEALKAATTRSIEDFELDWRRWVEAGAKASK